MLDPGRVSYQWTLRQIGAYLDEQGACCITLLEIPDGFVVRYQRELHTPERFVGSFARRELVFRDAELERTRVEMRGEGSGSGDASEEPGTKQTPGGYQDFFRALGYELDQGSIYTIGLDELDAGMVVTYLFVDPRYDFMPKKRLVFLSKQDEKKILDDAYARRRPSEEGQQAVLQPLKIFT